MGKAVSVNIRSVLARFMECDPLHAKSNSFETKETVKFVESELRYLGIGTERLPPWSLPFQTLPIGDTWRDRRAAEAAASLVAAVLDRKTGIKHYEFEADEWTLFTSIKATVESAGLLKYWRDGKGYGIQSRNVPKVTTPRVHRVVKSLRID